MAADLTIEVLTSSPPLIPALAPMMTMYVPDSGMAEDQAKCIKRVSATVAGSTAKIRVLGLHDDTLALARRAARAGPIADLVVIGGEDLWETQWLRRHAAEMIVMGAGSPLLALSEGNELPPVQKAVFGWKDSPEVRRVVPDLVMITEPGAKVTVVTVGGFADQQQNIQENAAEDVRHLTRRGLRAGWQQLSGENTFDAETLETFATEDGPDLLAIGAFAHSRLRETLLGGIARDFINIARLPVLCSR